MFNKINRQILKLSVPAIVSNITVPALGLFDTAISGHLGSELFLAAIAVGTVMLNIIFWLFGFLRTGTTGLTAVSLGSNDSAAQNKVFSRALLIGFTAGILLIIFRHPLLKLLSVIINADKSIDSLVQSYFMNRIWGAPALLSTMAISGWFVGMQNTVFPLVISISMNLINIFFSYFLVYILGLGFDGIALGTSLANYSGLIISFLCVIKFKKGDIIFARFKEVIKGEGWKKYFSVNSNLFIRSLCIICVTTGLTSAGAGLGVLVLGANVIVMQFFQFFSFFMDGFAFSGEALIGLYYGEKNLKDLKKSVKLLLVWTLSMSIIFTIIYDFFSLEISSLLTNNIKVIETIAGIKIFIMLIPIISAWAFIYDGFYVGLTQTRLMMVATLIASAVFFLITYIDFYQGEFVIRIRNNSTIWIAFLSYLGLRGGLLAFFWPWKMKTQLNRNSLNNY